MATPTPRTPRNTAQQARDRARIARTKPNCHICGEPINYTLKTPHPDSYELDHIVPLKRGGADNINNKAASHRKCNSRKRARLVAPIIRRSGSLD